MEVIGVNQQGQSTYNDSVTSSSGLPWLQDTAELGIWSAWEVAYRDVRVVTTQTELGSVYNLSSHNLADADNRAEMKQLLLEQAVIQDVDNDGLPDDWEALYLGETAASSGADDDPDGDGHGNFEEYAYGSHPRDAGSRPWVRRAKVADSDGIEYPAIAVSRRAGNHVRYEVRQSSNLKQWEGGSGATLGSQLIPVYDGSGTFVAVHASSTPFGDQRQGYLRVLAQKSP